MIAYVYDSFKIERLISFYSDVLPIMPGKQENIPYYAVYIKTINFT